MLAVACGGELFEIPIETPIQAKLDVSAFQRVLVAGFVAGGTDDVDTNQETVRLLRSQLRSKSSLRVIDADVHAAHRRRAGSEQGRGRKRRDRRPRVRPRAVRQERRAPASRRRCPRRSRNEKDLEPYDRLFANTAYWKRIGEEYQNPLIVTGTVLFAPRTSAGFVTRETEVYDGLGRRSVVPTRDVHGAQGLHPAAEVRLHRRPHGRDDLLR